MNKIFLIFISYILPFQAIFSSFLEQKEDRKVIKTKERIKNMHSKVIKMLRLASEGVYVGFCQMFKIRAAKFFIADKFNCSRYYNKK